MKRKKRSISDKEKCGLPGCRAWMGEICRQCILALDFALRAERASRKESRP